VVRALLQKGKIRPDQHVVAVLTGHVLKDPGILLQYHRETDPPPAGANRPIEIEPRLQDVERVLERLPTRA
jgi:threonine synthase